MACQITITSVNVYGSSGQPVDSVEVKGSATDCTGVVVTINCGGTARTQSVAVDSSGLWQAVFSDTSGTNCVCDDPNVALRVTATCKADPDCPPATRTLSPIPCESGTDCCPTVSIEVTEGGCDAQGRRNVTFKVTTTPATGAGCPDTVFAQLDFGDGMLGAGFVVPPNSVWIETHPYVPGSYTAKVRILAPLGCPDIPVKVGPLVECPPGCPDEDDIWVAVDDCDAEGRRIVSVNVLLPGSGSTTVSVDWQDGTPPDSNLPIQGGVLWTGWHHYLPPGPYKVTVSVAGCPPITKPVGPLEPCTVPPPPDPCKPWWHPKCWPWCLILGILLALLIAAYIESIAVGVFADIIAQLPQWILLVLGGAITAEALAGLVGGFLGVAILAYAMLCGPCYLWKVLLAGVVLALATIALFAIVGVPLPGLVPALWVAAAFILASMIAHSKCKE